ncbi:MAG TPA: hypothetical protein VFI62_17420 [Burkholderiales bacterium]|nr:hypothetical protein [Burkholderiales bacterium]
MLAGIVVYVVVDVQGDRAAAQSITRETKAAAPAPVATPSVPAAAVEPKPKAEKREALALPERAGFERKDGSLFESRSWQPPPPPPPPAAKAGPPPRPVAPPVPYRLIGRLIQDGNVVVYLGKGDSVLSATLGETVEGVYKVASITDTEISLIYLPLNQTQTLPIEPSAAMPSVSPTIPNFIPPSPRVRSEPGSFLPTEQVIEGRGRR